MMTFTMRQARDATENPLDCCLYVVRDGDTVFYVGSTGRGVFSRLLWHVGEGEWGRRGLSSLGDLITENAPESDLWQVDCYTLIEIKQTVERQFPGRAGYGVGLAEKALIRELRPCLNATYNENPSPLPQHYKGTKQIFTEGQAPCDFLGLG